MIRNVIFDFGAVLFDWQPKNIVKRFTTSPDEQALLLREVLHHPDWLSLDRGTMLMAEVIPKFAARTRLSESRMQDFIHHILDNLIVIDETFSLVEELKDKGYRLFYLTNMSSAFFENLNERHQLHSLFEGGLVSGKELVIKPETDIFNLLAERFMLEPSESLFIDDQPANIDAAKSLGFNGYLFAEPALSCAEIRKFLISH